MSQYNNGPLTLLASAALAQYRRVKLDGNGELEYAGAADTDCIGTLSRAALAADEAVAVIPRVGVGSQIRIASEAISAGAAVYAAASGKVASTGTVLDGIALTAATADGDAIEVMPSASAILGAIARSALTQDDLKPYTIPLTELRVTGTGALLGTAAGTPSGAFGITVGTHGSATPIVVGEAANANSKTNKARLAFALPAEYVDGQTITLRVRARITGNVQVAQTIDATAYKSDLGGGVGSDLVATAAQTLTASFANYDFTITPTGVAAGDLLDIELTGVANDTGGTANKLIEIGAVQLLVDIKG